MNRIELLQQLEEKARQETNNAIKYVLLQQLADTSVEEGEFESAFTVYEQALSIAQNMHDLKLECDTLIDLGSTVESLNEIDLAIDFYEQALEIAQKMHDFRAQNRIRGKLGIIFAKRRSINRAIEYIEQATDAARAGKAEKIIVQEEQTVSEADSEAQNNIGENLNQITVLQTHTDINNQFEQVRRLRKAPRRIALVANVPLILVIIGVIVYLISSKNVTIVLILFIIFCVITLIYLVIYALSPID